MFDIFVRRQTEDEIAARHAVYMDDIDLLLSPRDGMLVVVAQRDGKHVCQTCGKIVSFDDGVEVRFGHARVLLHPGNCAEGKQSRTSRYFNWLVRGTQYRRGLAHAAKLSQGVVDAAESRSGIIV